MYLISKCHTFQNRIEKSCPTVSKTSSEIEFWLTFIGVNLDFLDGNTIQCACDSSTGQYRVYHGKHTIMRVLPY